MPAPRPALTEADVRTFVEERCFLTGTGRVGAELEWFVTGDVPHPDVEAAAAGTAFPGGSTLTFEPGGQVELSSAPGSLGQVHRALGLDARALRRRLASVGAGLLATGVHPDREPCRVLALPRYEAMEAFWGAGGEHDPGAGLAMMCTTAAIQVCLDAALAGGAGQGGGPDGGGGTGGSAGRDERWRLAHALSPVLSAAFANSPVAGGRLTGWRSWRLGIWESLDRTRTAPALRTGRAVDDWTEYLLAANVMLIRSTGDTCAAVRGAFPFRRWLVAGHELGWPTLEDLEYHLSTLFPPVRARGWLEVRGVDALPEPWWVVPVAVAHALLDDPEAADGAALATGRAAWCWCEAPRWSLSYEPLASAAKTCFALAVDALGRLGAPASVIGVVDGYRERFVERGRCPADDTLDALARAGAPDAMAVVIR